MLTSAFGERQRPTAASRRWRFNVHAHSVAVFLCTCSGPLRASSLFRLRLIGEALETDERTRYVSVRTACSAYDDVLGSPVHARGVTPRSHSPRTFPGLLLCSRRLMRSDSARSLSASMIEFGYEYADVVTHHHGPTSSMGTTPRFVDRPGIT